MLSVYNPRTKSFRNFKFQPLTDFPVYSQPAIVTILSDSSGRIYFGVASAIGLISTHTILYKDEGENDIKRLGYSDSLGIQNIYHSVMDRQDNIWFVADNGLFRLDNERKMHLEKWPSGLVIPENRFNIYLTVNNQGRMWAVSTEEVLYEWNPGNGGIKSYPIFIRR